MIKMIYESAKNTGEKYNSEELSRTVYFRSTMF